MSKRGKLDTNFNMEVLRLAINDISLKFQQLGFGHMNNKGFEVVNFFKISQNSEFLTILGERYRPWQAQEVETKWNFAHFYQRTYQKSQLLDQLIQ